MEKQTQDHIDHPSHYQGNGLEVIEVIEAFDLDYILGNSMKYILRAGKKGSKLEDLMKASWYIHRAIQKEKLLEEEKLYASSDNDRIHLTN